MIAKGRLVEVVEEYDGASAVADVLTGGTVVPIADDGDFPEDGLVQIGDASYGYILDPDTMTLTLDTPLVEDVAEGDPVTSLSYLSRPEVTVIAYVLLDEDDGSEPVPAVVDTANQPYFPLGTTAAGALVNVESTADSWKVVSRAVEKGVFNGDVIDPDTVPERPPDGLPPATSPTPTVSGGIGSLHVKWAESENADPVSYRIYISTTTPVPIGAASLLGEFVGSYAYIDRLPNGDPLTPGVQYLLVMVAFDADGSAPPGGEVAGTPTQAVDPQDITDLETSMATLEGKFPIGSTDISDGAITTPKMTANSINGDRIAANTLHAGKIVSYSITALQIGADQIKANHIDAGAVQAGAIQAGAIDGMTITGALIRTSSGTARVQMQQNDGLSAYNGSGDRIVHISSTDGVATIKRLRTGTSGNRVEIADTVYSWGGTSSEVELHTGSSYAPARIGASAYGSQYASFIAPQQSTEAPPGLFFTNGGSSGTQMVELDGKKNVLIQGTTQIVLDGPTRLGDSSSSAINGDRFGVVTATTDGTGVVSVNHGLGVTPANIQITGNTIDAWHYNIGGYNSSSFNVRVRDDAGANVANTTVSFFWEAKA